MVPVSVLKLSVHRKPPPPSCQDFPLWHHHSKGSHIKATKACEQVRDNLPFSGESIKDPRDFWEAGASDKGSTIQSGYSRKHAEEIPLTPLGSVNKRCRSSGPSAWTIIDHLTGFSASKGWRLNFPYTVSQMLIYMSTMCDIKVSD